MSKNKKQKFVVNWQESHGNVVEIDLEGLAEASNCETENLSETQIQEAAREKAITGEYVDTFIEQHSYETKEI